MSWPPTMRMRRIEYTLEVMVFMHDDIITVVVPPSNGSCPYPGRRRNRVTKLKMQEECQGHQAAIIVVGGYQWYHRGLFIQVHSAL